MRVVFTCVAAPGHFHPLVPLARALDAAGHDVAFATGPTLAQQVAASGFAFFEAGMDARAVFVEHPEMMDLAPLARNEVWLRRLFPEWLAERLLPDLLSVYARWPPDLVISDSCEFAGRIAAEYWAV